MAKLLMRQIVVILLCSGLASCTYLGSLFGKKPIPPKAELTAVKVSKVTFTSLDIDLTVSLQNKNDFDISFSKLVYKIFSLDMEVARGAYDKRFTLPANKSSKIVIPLSLKTDALIKVMQQYLKDPKKLVFILDGKCLFDSPFGDIEVEFREERGVH